MGHVVALFVLIGVVAALIFGFGWFFGSFGHMFDDFREGNGPAAPQWPTALTVSIIVVCLILNFIVI